MVGAGLWLHARSAQYRQARKKQFRSVPPFELTQEDEWLCGRGTQEIKGVAAAEAAAFLQLEQEGIIPRRDLILALTTGEEGGTFYNGMDWLLKNPRELIDAKHWLKRRGSHERPPGHPRVPSERKGLLQLCADSHRPRRA
jgi:hypothetical protein